MKRIVSAALLTGALLASERANAEPATTARLVYLHGRNTESCPTEAELRDAVAARLGYEPFSAWALDTLFVEVERAAQARSGFVARVKLVTPQNEVRGARELTTTAACSDLMNAMALTISLAVDPTAGTRDGPPEGLPPRERPVLEPAPSSSVVDSPPMMESEADSDASTKSREEAPRFAFGGSVGLVGAIGSAPGPTGGISASLEGRWGFARLAIEGRADSIATAEGSRGGRVSSSLASLAVAPCLHKHAIFACAVATLGELRAEGMDIRSPKTTSAVYGTVGGRLGYEVALSRVFFARAHVGADAVLTRYALYVSGQETFRYSALAVSIGLSAGGFWR